MRKQEQRTVAPWAWWPAFLPFLAVAVCHVVACFAGWDELAAPSKLLLMPALAGAVLWVGRTGRIRVPGWLLAALGLSWLGDGAGTFFPFAPTLPAMLLCFGAAHLCYLRLFWRQLRVRALPVWVLPAAFGWWLLLLLLLWPRSDGLGPGLAGYGLLLGGTAVVALRCPAVVRYGALLFLASDTVLALWLFAPELLPAFSDGLVMLSYVLGQGLIAAGVLQGSRPAAGQQKTVQTPDVSGV